MLYKIFYETFCTETLDSNSYLLYTKLYDVNEAVVIDAGGCFEEITARAEALKLKISAVFLTHGHIDHTEAVPRYREAGIRVGISEADAYMLGKCKDNLAKYLGIHYEGSKADFTFKDGDEFHVGGMVLKVRATPGHTVGSCCFLCNNVCFSGDTLFYESVGRTDFPTGDAETELRSLRALVKDLPAETLVLPGHNEPTTIEHERDFNPYFGGKIC